MREKLYARKKEDDAITKEVARSANSEYDAGLTGTRAQPDPETQSQDAATVTPVPRLPWDKDDDASIYARRAALWANFLKKQHALLYPLPAEKRWAHGSLVRGLIDAIGYGYERGFKPRYVLVLSSRSVFKREVSARDLGNFLNPDWYAGLDPSKKIRTFATSYGAQSHSVGARGSYHEMIKQ